MEPTLDKMTWERPSAKMVKLMPVGQKAAGSIKSQVENVPGAWQRKCKGPKWKRVQSVLERGRRHAGWGRVSHRKTGVMHWEGEDLSGWQAVDSFGIAPQVGGEPLKGSPQGSAVTFPPKWDQDPVTALGPSQPGGWGLDRLALRQHQSREGWVLIHGVWATDPQFPGPEDEPQPRRPGRLASLLSPVLVPYGKLRLEKALGFLNSLCPGCCRRVRASILPGLRLGRRDTHSGVRVSKLQAHVPFQTLLEKGYVSQCLSYRRTCSDRPHFPSVNTRRHRRGLRNLLDSKCDGSCVSV